MVGGLLPKDCGTSIFHSFDGLQRKWVSMNNINCRCAAGHSFPADGSTVCSLKSEMRGLGLIRVFAGYLIIFMLVVVCFVQFVSVNLQSS